MPCKTTPVGKVCYETMLGTYFINMQHLRYFSKAYPGVFHYMRYGEIIDQFRADCRQMSAHTPTWASRATLATTIGMNATLLEAYAT